MSFFGSTEFYLEVAKGNVEGHSILNVTGRNAAVGISFEDIWGGGLLDSLDYDAQTVNFTPGDVLTGGTSAATAIIVIDDDSGTTGTLVLRKLSGTFVDNEVITDASGGSADADGTTVSLGILTYPTTGEQWEIVAESADDDVTGIGARTVGISYLDENFVQQSTSVDLDGNTPSLFTPTDMLCPIVAAVGSFGSATNALFGKANLGTIVIRDSVSKQIRTVIPFDDSIAGDEHGLNITRDSHASIPAGKTGFITTVFTNTSKNHEVDTIILIRSFGDDNFIAGGEVSVYQNTTDHDGTMSMQAIAEKTNIKFISRSNNTAVDVNVAYGILLVDN